jgi:hypothetical protein
MATPQEIAAERQKKQRHYRAIALGNALAQHHDDFASRYGADARKWPADADAEAERQAVALWASLAGPGDAEDPGFMALVNEEANLDAERGDVRNFGNSPDPRPTPVRPNSPVVPGRASPITAPIRQLATPAPVSRRPQTAQEIARDRLSRRVQDFFSQPPAEPWAKPPKPVQAPAVDLPDDPNPTGAR